jgi:hypothetical protein
MSPRWSARLIRLSTVVRHWAVTVIVVAAAIAACGRLA